MAVVDTSRRAVRLFREENVPFRAASVAYYALASLVPLSVVALAVLSVLGTADVFVSVLAAYLSDSGERMLRDALTSTRGRGVAGAAGFLLALWGATKVFRGLSLAFAGLYRESSDVSLVGRLVRSAVVFGLLLSVLALLSVTAVALAYARPAVPHPVLVGAAAAALALVVVLLPVYYVLPPVSVTLRHALPGAVVAAVGLAALPVAFLAYVQFANRYAAYGALGAVVLFVTFLYVAGIVLLTGAVVNVVSEGRTARLGLLDTAFR